MKKNGIFTLPRNGGKSVSEGFKFTNVPGKDAPGPPTGAPPSAAPFRRTPFSLVNYFYTDYIYDNCFVRSMKLGVANKCV